MKVHVPTHQLLGIDSWHLHRTASNAGRATVVGVSSEPAPNKREKKPTALPMDEIAAAIVKLSPEEAAFFLHKLEAANRKRRVQLWGYLTALIMWALTMIFALVYYAYSPPGVFVGWIFIVPFAVVGVLVLLFGKWADSIETLTPPQATKSTTD